jgi:hypothetical protein
MIRQNYSCGFFMAYGLNRHFKEITFGLPRRRADYAQARPSIVVFWTEYERWSMSGLFMAALRAQIDPN